MKAKHTAGKLVVLEPRPDPQANEIDGSYSCTIYAEGYGSLGYWKGHKKWHNDSNWILSKEDAERICLCWNSHDALVEACKALLEELRLIRLKDSGAVYDPTCRIRAEVAIAKAEGGAE